MDLNTNNLNTDQQMKLAEKKKAFKRNIFLTVAVFLTVIYLTWRIFFTLPFEAGIPQVIFGILLINAEIITCFTTFELYYRKFKADEGILDFPEVDHKYYPDVDVFIATHNEPVDILFKTANACTFMDYPDKSKVHIYFCDDGNRPQVAELARDLGIGYIGMSGNTEAKSGNLNNALAKTNSPLIATFDADMIPQHTFLMKTVPYFFLPTFIKDEESGLWRKRTEEEVEDVKDKYKIGLIQTPQSFYNPDLFQFNLYSEKLIPNEQDFFSREVNIMRNSSNACAYTGSNTLIARQGIVDIGGFPTETITEDFEVSIRLQQEHYITYATSEVQAAGLTTTDFKSMIKQRNRWARGIIQSLYNTKAVFSTKLSLAARITYLTSYLYWWSFFNRIIFILAPIMFALFDFQVVNCTFEELLIFWLPSYFFYSFSFRFLSSNVRTNRWSQTIDTIFAPYMITSVILETFGIRERKFKITNKEKTERSDFIYATPHIILIVLSVLAIIRFTTGKYGWMLVYSSIIIFWLFYNLVSLTYAVFFMIGRKSYRKSERISAQIPIEISYGNVKLSAETVDVSDDGMLFVSDKAIYVPDGGEATIVAKSDRYEAHLKAHIAYVRPKDDKWYYAVTVEAEDLENQRQYAQLIYDRSHSLPKTTDPWSTIFDDVKRNIRLRLSVAPAQRRKQARVDINRFVGFVGGGSGYIHDFNYHFFAISNLTAVADADGCITMIGEDGSILKLKDTGKVIAKNNSKLFEVANLDELIEKGIDLSKIITPMTQ